MRRAECFYPNIEVACLLVFKLGRVDDVFRIEQAKLASYDTECALDVRFFFGAGVEATLDYLGKQTSEQAISLATTLREIVHSGELTHQHSGGFESIEAWLGEVERRLLKTSQ